MVIGGITEKCSEAEVAYLNNSCRTIGETLRDSDHSLVVCSPFKDSADYWVFKGYTQEKSKANNKIELHFVDMPAVRAEIADIEGASPDFTMVKIPHPAPDDRKKESLSYAWLLCQLEALESCHAIIAIGGKLNGAANMLLLLAEAKRKPIIPFSFIGGASGEAFCRNRYLLEDRFGKEYVILQEENHIQKALKLCDIHRIQLKFQMTHSRPNFFISYPCARPNEADYIETLLRRRNMQVYRDESDFGAGHAIPNEITEAIYAANVFIAIWCVEYACSPWCFDELELALDRRDSGEM